MHAAESAEGVPRACDVEDPGGAPKPGRAAHVAAASNDPKGAGRRTLRVDLARGTVVRAEKIVDGVGDPLFDVPREVVDAVRRAAHGKRPNRSELDEPVAVVRVVEHGAAV